MKTNIKEILILGAILMVIIIWLLIHDNYENKKISEAKEKMLLEEIEKNKITEDERFLIELKKENDKTKIEIKTINEEIEELDENLWEKEFIQECILIQIQRAIQWKDIEDWYCDKKLDEKTHQTTKIDPVRVSIPKKDIVYSKDNFKIKKSTLFMCLEIKNTFGLKNDENRCATMMTMVKFLETENWTTGIWSKYNNMYWIKNPTDKNWLLGNWKKADENNIIFETKEMSSYAFAYYYSKYHNHRNMDQFVDRYVAWDNQKYKANLKYNYNWIYNEYKNLLK